MSQPLSDQTIALVKATVPALEAHGLDIVHEMYSRMFQNPTPVRSPVRSRAPFSPMPAILKISVRLRLLLSGSRKSMSAFRFCPSTIRTSARRSLARSRQCWVT
jgi:hypothetical protein